MSHTVQLRSTNRFGSFVTGQVGHRVGPKRRWWLLFSSSIQVVLIFISSILLYTSTVSTEDISNLGLVVLLAFAFGSQAAAGRPLGVAPITTVVVTSASKSQPKHLITLTTNDYCPLVVDLWADKKLFAPLGGNAGRNQRVAFILTFFVGGIVGGLALVHVNAAFVLLLSGIVKTIAGALFLFAKAKPRQEDTKPLGPELPLAVAVVEEDASPPHVP